MNVPGRPRILNSIVIWAGQNREDRTVVLKLSVILSEAKDLQSA